MLKPGEFVITLKVDELELLKDQIEGTVQFFPEEPLNVETIHKLWYEYEWTRQQYDWYGDFLKTLSDLNECSSNNVGAMRELKKKLDWLPELWREHPCGLNTDQEGIEELT